jgi:hypothetical protein
LECCIRAINNMPLFLECSCCIDFPGYRIVIVMMCIITPLQNVIELMEFIKSTKCI